MAIYHGEILEVGFTRSFYKHILGIPLTLRDLETVDHEYYKFVLLQQVVPILLLTVFQEIFYGSSKTISLPPIWTSYFVPTWISLDRYDNLKEFHF